MTEIEKKLLVELEQLENEREQERKQAEESLKKLTEEWQNKQIELSDSLKSSYQEALMNLISEEESEKNALIELLNSMAIDQKKIIELLSKPSDTDSIAKQLQPLFTEFLNGLTIESQKSQTALTEVKELLTNLTNGLEQ